MAPTSAEFRGSPSTGRLVWLFRMAFTCALAVSGVVLVFFIWGVLDGSVSSFNSTLWLALLALVAAAPLAGWHLRARGRLRSAILVLSVLALPGLLYSLFILLLVVSGVSWN